MSQFVRTYGFSLVFSAVCLGAAAWWGMQHPGMGIGAALWLCLVLAILEVSLSFDNAVVNASVLRTMTPFWQKIFLTIGILIAVFGMRLVFPIVIVAFVTGLGIPEVIDLALNQPHQYSQVLTDAYPMIATFGGAFLLMVFLNFVMNPEQEHFWITPLEVRLSQLGTLGSAQVFVALLVVTGTALSMAEPLKYAVLISGVLGLLLFVAINLLDQAMQKNHSPVLPAQPDLLKASGLRAPVGKKSTATVAVAKAGFSAFLYLEVLDASFSFDGVIGAFAITRDVVIIMLGLAIGAIFVRSMTIDLVRRKTLENYLYLEHGAHYAIGVLAGIMFAGTHVHVPEVFTGLVGVAFIAASLWSSVRKH